MKKMIHGWIDSLGLHTHTAAKRTSVKRAKVTKRKVAKKSSRKRR